MKILILAASLAAALVAGCADLNGTYAASGASSQTERPYPAVTDRGLF